MNKNLNLRELLLSLSQTTDKKLLVGLLAKYYQGQKEFGDLSTNDQVSNLLAKHDLEISNIRDVAKDNLSILDASPILN